MSSHLARSAQYELKKHVGAVHVKGKLSLLQRKVNNVLLLNAYEELADETISEHVIDLRTLASVSAFDSNDRQLLRDALEALVDTKIRWNILGPDGEEEWGVSTFLAQAITKGGKCYYAYAPGLRRRLFNPAIYARINLSVQERFSSAYALALYENCVRFRRVGSTGWFDLERWRDLLGVGEQQYEEFKYLKRSVLVPAVREVNEHSDIHVTMETRREKRRIVALKFAIRENTQLKLELARENDSAVRELGASLLPDAQSLAPSPDQLLGPLQLRLKEFGLTDAQAMDLSTEFSADHVERNLRHVQGALDAGKQVRSVPAFTLEAIRSDYAAATGEAPAQASARRTKAAKQRASTVAASPEALRAAQQADRRKAEWEQGQRRIVRSRARYDALSQGARASVDRQAVSAMEREDPFTFSLYQSEVAGGRVGDAHSPAVRSALDELRERAMDAL